MAAYDRVLRLVVALLMATMVSVAFLQVVMRFAFNQPLTWSEEVARYAFVWVTFVAAAIGLERGIHIGVDLLIGFFPDVLRRAIELVTSVLVIVTLLVLIYFGFRQARVNMIQVSPILGLPMGVPYGAIPVGGVIMLFGTLRRTVAVLRGQAGKAAP